MFQPHLFGDNLIEELSRYLYKQKKSAIKEGCTNALDQQIEKKEKRIEISTHVGPDDDIWIEDWGTGVENFERFTYIGKGYKVVGDRVSSYTEIDEDIGGNKGLGKLGFLSLSDAEEPRVEFYSHRPTVEGKYKSQGAIIIMSRKGFDVEYVDAIEALSHPGVRVVIKKAKYHLLPREGDLRKYLAKMFAIRIARGAKIFLDGSKISAPEDFESKAEYLFPLSDGSVVYGNIKSCDKPDVNNISLNIKNIYVDSWTYEHKAEGWMNDNLIVPTSSRESIEETDRLAEIQYKMTEYLDERYDKPSSPKINKMGKEREKQKLLVDLMQYRNNQLSGRLNPKSSVIGEITGGLENKGKLEKMTGVKLTNTGEKEGEPVIPIGKGTRGTGGRYGGDGTKPGYEPNGDHDILTTSGKNQRLREGPITAEIKHIPHDFGLDKPMAFLPDVATFNWNISWPQTRKANDTKGVDWVYVVAPVYAQAMVNFDNQNEDLTAQEWQEKYADYMKFMIDKVEN